MVDKQELDTVSSLNSSSNFDVMEAILRRDQRTTCHRVQRSRTECGSSEKTVSCDNSDFNNGRRLLIKHDNVNQQCATSHCVPVMKNFLTNCDRGFATSCSWRRSSGRTWLRLGSLLVILLLVSVQGAPTTMSLEKHRQSKPKWLNPCGEVLAAEESDGYSDINQLTDAELLDVVVIQARNALSHATEFREKYAKHTLNTDFAVLLSEWRGKSYDWLPGPDKIPKQLGEPLSAEYLSKFGLETLDNVLLDVYEYMQIYAVGLEQIVWDQEDHRLEFLQDFKDTESSLQAVLCELQVALMERGVTPRNNTSRDVMSNEYRGQMSAQTTNRVIRDWLIFRDYMNGLEYMIQLLEHIRQDLKS